MIITLINLLSDKINNFRRRNRNQPSYYRLFLFWLTLIILITAIFYILNNLALDNIVSNNNFNENDITEVTNIAVLPTQPTTGISNIIQDNSNMEPISNLVSTVSQPGIYAAPKSELYHEVLNQVGKIPKPLSFVDDFNYKL